MRASSILSLALALLFFVFQTDAAEQTKYPAPRFPSYTKAPKSVD